jgi:hypothetical protein
MSVTISIENDRDESIVESYECQWCNGQGCDKCQNGKVVFRSSKWQLQMANGNFSTVMSALGLCASSDDGLCGALDARVVLAALDRLNPQLAVRAERKNKNVIHCGIDQEYVERRVALLREIATEAARREEMVVWC